MRKLIAAVAAVLSIMIFSSSAPAFAGQQFPHQQHAELTATASVASYVSRDTVQALQAEAARGQDNQRQNLIAAHAVVHSGDSLSKIASRAYGSASLWPALWWVNRRDVQDPDAIRAGQVLVLSSWHPRYGWLIRRAMAAVPHPVPVPSVRRAVAVNAWQPARQPVLVTYTYSGSGGFQACVVRAESGGNPRAVNPSSGAGGLYQFLPSTWAALGFPGLPEDASVAMQNEAFAKEYAESGTSAWQSYDGC